MGKYPLSDGEAARKRTPKEVKARPMKTGEPLKPLEKRVKKQAPKKAVKAPSKKLAKRSKKGRQHDRIYNVLAKDFKADHPMCQAALIGCTQLTEDIHHKAGRGANLTNVDTFLAVCRNCHDSIEQDPAMAREMGFSISRLGKVVK